MSKISREQQIKELKEAAKNQYAQKHGLDMKEHDFKITIALMEDYLKLQQDMCSFPHLNTEMNKKFIHTMSVVFPPKIEMGGSEFSVIYDKDGLIRFRPECHLYCMNVLYPNLMSRNHEMPRVTIRPMTDYGANKFRFGDNHLLLELDNTEYAIKVDIDPYLMDGNVGRISIYNGKQLDVTGKGFNWSPMGANETLGYDWGGRTFNNLDGLITEIKRVQSLVSLII